jgi:mannose-6-phosphate isomerase-like protein (cupin superfamily)
MFTPEETGAGLVGSWAFLGKGMKSIPHRHPAKEIYFFTGGKGSVQVGHRKASVRTGDAVFIPPNTLHCAENTGEDDLEYICISFDLNAPTILFKILSLLHDFLFKTASSQNL